MTNDKTPTSADPGTHSSAGESVKARPVKSSHDEDLELMNRVAAGDRQAQAVAARRLVGRIRRLAKMMLLDDALADDAAQNSLLEVLGSAHTFRGQASLERWSDRITARTAIRHKRSERRHEGVEPTSDADGGVAPAPGDGLLTESTARPLNEYLAALSESQREVLILKHSFEYTTEEIAELTDSAVGTVKDRLVSGRKQLRKLIQRDLTLGTRGGRQRDDE
jgi:RNA polymerase sigma-70 factor (ECF subfamily)